MSGTKPIQVVVRCKQRDCHAEAIMTSKPGETMAQLRRRMAEFECGFCQRAKRIGWKSHQRGCELEHQQMLYGV